jgi:hypothetical protein
MAFPETRIREHHWHMYLEHPAKLAMAEHCIKLTQKIQFQDTSILSMESTYVDWMIREATETKLYANNMNMKFVAHAAHSL